MALEGAKNLKLSTHAYLAQLDRHQNKWFSIQLMGYWYGVTAILLDYKTSVSA